MADLTIGHVRQVANWYATRDDDYSSPFVKGMNRAKNGKRDRTLSDGEIRSLWRQTENNGAFGAIVRLALLTAQRREKVLAMRWADISVDGVWTVPVDARQKGTGGALQLPQIAIDIIRAQHRIEGNPFVFAGRGGSHFGGVSRHKAALDVNLHFTKPWVVHDLRRTARSLMARAGVSSEHAERVMGHAITGVEGVYDRHSYNEEKADALARLAALIDDIINGTPDKIVKLKPKARANA
jgi:integrase